MRSSIFNSKHPAFFYAKFLVGICMGAAIIFEVLANYSLKHHSETYARVAQQYTEALKSRPSRPGEPASVLMVGNSLLLYGVDVDRLRALTSDRMRVYPIFLEATGYYDWLYALQRLFRDGARPQVVVLGIGMNYFFSDSVRRDYAPMMFLDTRDALAVASELKMDNSATADLLLAHSSAFWDLRGVFRIQVLRHTIPHSKELLSLVSSPAPIPAAAQFDATASGRLVRLRELCASYGAKLIVLVPPAPNSEDSVRRLLAVSRDAAVDTLVPIDPASLSTHYYLSDEIHLNPDGARLFTTALATYLPQQAVSTPANGSN